MDEDSEAYPGSGTRGDGYPEEGYSEEEMERQYREEYAGSGSRNEGYSEEDYSDAYMDEEEDGYSDGYMDEEDGYGSGRPGARPPRPVTLEDKAYQAFGEGRGADGFQYLYAYAVTAEESAATDLLGTMGLLAAAKRPALAVRWGIGVDYTGAEDYKNNAYPIGVTQTASAGGRGGAGDYGAPSASGMSAPGGFGEEGYDEEGGYGSGGYGSGGMGRGGASGTDPQLKALTGELGERLMGGLRERISQGVFGKVLAQAMARPSRRPGGGDYAYGSGYEEEYEDDYEEDYGPGGSGRRGGSSGPGYGGGYGGGYGASGGQPAAGPAAREFTQLAPGVVFLGVADAKDLKAQAKAAQLDVLCIFDVGVKPRVSRGAITIINETSLAMYNMLDAKNDEFETGTLNNVRVQVLRQSGDDDGVEAEMKKLFQYIDSTWRLTDLPPNLTEEGVLARLRPLITEPQENPLPILAEVRMYKTRGLLNDQNFAIACKGLIGEQAATTLASGTEEEKKQAIAKWIPSGG
jgi:hypothetical protein